MDIVGGVYREICDIPPWNEIYGSGGRAAAAISRLSPGSSLHSYAGVQDRAFWDALKRLGLNLHLQASSTDIAFVYFHGLSTPHIAPAPSAIPKLEPLRVEGDTVLRFGMLEGDAVVDARRAVYDPQGGSASKPFEENGSRASELAVVLNEREAEMMEAALLRSGGSGPDVFVIKRGALGATVISGGSKTHIAPYRSGRVFKIGSGDVFSGIFALFWGEQGLHPVEAAQCASKYTAAYCETATLPVDDAALVDLTAVVGTVPGLIYIEGSVQTIGQRYTMEEARHRIKELGGTAIAPSLGDAEPDSPPAVTLQVAAGGGIERNNAKHDRLVVLAEGDTNKAYGTGDMRGFVTDDFVTALYWTVWQAMAPK